MKNSTKLVLDLNLFVSALIGRPATRTLLDHWREQHFVLILSAPLVEQLLAVLLRPKFKHYFSDDDVRELSELISQYAQIVEPTLTLSLCRDAKDNILLEVAAAGRANFLVTGDKDLLDDPELVKTMLEQYGVAVVTASRMLELLSEPR